MNDSRKVLDHNPRYIDSFYGLGVEYDEEDHIEAIDLVREILTYIRDELYSSSGRKRAHIYYELLRQNLDMMEIDGGPNFALKLLRYTVEDCKLVASEDESKIIGPSLTKEQLEWLRHNYWLPIEPDPEVG